MLELILATAALLWAFAFGALGVISTHAMNNVVELIAITVAAAMLVRAVGALLSPLMKKVIRHLPE